jgi:hypothetical protein
MDGEQDWEEAEIDVGRRGTVAALNALLGESGWIATMYVRYAVVGCCFIAAAILLIISSNSYRGTDECRNWLARSVTSLFMPCVAKAQVNDPLNIGTAMAKEPNSQNKR